jgi:glycosyltransferase involved in cell wall biosynthesis
LPLTIAYFSPLPPQRSGIADYSAALLPDLAEHCALELYVDQPEQIDRTWAQRFPVYAIADFLARPSWRWRYDGCLYHMGNQPKYHEFIYRALVQAPGVVVLHETDLMGFHLHRPAAGPVAFIREMGYAYGSAGTQAAHALLPDWSDVKPQTYPLFDRIVRISHGLIVHTDAARRQILETHPRARVVEVPLAARAPAAGDGIENPDWLARLPAAAVVLASFGYIAPSKRINIALQAMARVQDDFPNLYFVVIGELADQYDLMPLIQQLGLRDRVHLTGFVDEATYEAYLRAVDIGVSLRTGPTGGEMSAGAARLLAAGKPTIVSNVGGFAELPTPSVIKIDQDEQEVDRLAAALRRLLDNPAARAAYGAAARRYAEQELSFARVARQYAAFIHECLTERKPNHVKG